MEDETLQVQTVSGLAVDLPLVDIGGRSTAYLLDLLISGVVAIGWIFIVALILGASITFNPLKAFGHVLQDGGAQNLFIWIGLVPAYVFLLLYHPLLEWWMRGRTPGKKIAGIRIVMQDGTEPRTVPILVRNLFRLIDSMPSVYLVGIFVAMFSKRHQRIGDMAAGTVLIYEERPKKIDQYLQQHLNSEIAPQQLDLLLELKRRWSSLQRQQRIDLADRLLQKLGQAIELEGLSEAEQDRQLQQQILSLLGG